VPAGMRWPQISSSTAQRRVTTGTTEYFLSVSCGGASASSGRQDRMPHQAA